MHAPCEVIHYMCVSMQFGGNTSSAVSMQITIFVLQLLHLPEGEAIECLVTRCREAEYRVWVKTMTELSIRSSWHYCLTVPFVLG
jgi:hypothetical protein